MSNDHASTIKHAKHRRWINTAAEARLIADPNRPQPLRTLANGDFTETELEAIHVKAEQYLNGAGRWGWVLPFGTGDTVER